MSCFFSNSCLVSVPLVPKEVSPRSLFDSLPTFQLGHGAHPLTQLQAWIAGESLWFHCASYETAPSFESGFTVNLFPEKGKRRHYLTVDFTVQSFSFRVSGAPAPQAVSLSRDGGENQQGVYWGGTLEIPLSLLENLSPDFAPVAGVTLEGNCYKYCPTPPHIYYANLFDPPGGTFALCAY